MKTFEQNIRKVIPYVPGEQPKGLVVKLNTNENPYPPAVGVQRAIDCFHREELRRYPDPTSGNLVQALADYYQLDPKQVFVGVGSDDVLAMCFLTFFNSEEPILFPDVTYSFYKVWAQLYKIPYECPKLDSTFRIKREDYYRLNGGVIFPNPNAPTSIYEELEFVEDIIKHNLEVVVIIDEAYIDFAGKSALELISKYENLLVVQTFSKARSMAGMRVGYAMGNPKLIQYLNDVKYSFNSYTMSQAALTYGVEAVKDRTYFEATINKIIETREWTKDALGALGFDFPNPKGNFIFVTHPYIDAKKLFEALKKQGIYVRYWQLERLEQYLRISIGTQSEMELLITFLQDYIQAEHIVTAK